MRVETFPSDYDWREQFPNARCVATASFEQLYAAEHDDKFYLIYDGSTAANLLLGLDRELGVSDEDTQQFASKAIQIFEFDSEDEREAYQQQYWHPRRWHIDIPLD
jgi:hypothetical protein